MKKAKKTRTQQRRSKLDQIAAQVRTALRSQTKNVIEIGKLLIESRKHLEHGEWQAWLAENFDLSYRTAVNYTNAAEYVARKFKSETVSHSANLSATVLYHLAAGHFDERVEAAILAAARERRIDEDAMWAISEKLAPADDDDADDAGDQDHGDEDRHASGGEKDAESEAILDGPPPAVPPPAENQLVTNFALRVFDQAISALKQLMTKPSTEFTGTAHSAKDLEHVVDFIRAVAKSPRSAAADGNL
jgi:hypothetical protein